MITYYKPSDVPHFKSGMTIRVAERQCYQSLVVNAVITPPIEHTLSAYNTTIRAVYREEEEDADGNLLVSLTLETRRGELVDPSEVTILV